MAIYDNLPYTNFHELNADWLLKQMKEAKAKVDSIQDDIDQFNATYAALAAVLTVAGNNVSIPGTMTANVFIGNLTGNVTGDVTGNASTADEALDAVRLVTYHVPYTEDLNRALTGSSLKSRIWSISDPMLNRPSDVTVLEKGTVFVLGTGQLKTVNGKSCAVEVQYLWPSVTQKVYYRYVYEDTATFTLEDADNWSELVSSVSHATTADSATTATSATSATNATNATNATTANNATYSVKTGGVSAYPKIGRNDLDMVYPSMNSVSFEYCVPNATNLPTSFGSGAIVMSYRYNSNGDTIISQYAFNPLYMRDGANGNAVAMRYGVCSGITDADPQDETFSWVSWRYLIGTSA